MGKYVNGERVPDTCKTPRVPIQTPMFDQQGLLTRTWVIFFERLAGCGEIAVVTPPTPGPEPEPDPEFLPASYRYHCYTKRDGRLYINRLEIDTGNSDLKSILVEVHWEDEAHGIPDVVNVSEYEISLDHDLMGTVDRIPWERAIELPQASVHKVGVKIRCYAGDTEYLYAWPAGTDSLQVMPEPDPETVLPTVRTMGHPRYQLAVRMVRPVAPGADAFSIADAYEEVKATGPQTFYRAYAEVSDSFAKGGDLPPIDIPGTVSRFEPADFGGTGTLTLSGTPGEATVTVKVTGDAEVSFTGDIDGATLIECAANLADAINASLFGEYFSAAATDEVIDLTQQRNYIGTLSATLDSTVALSIAAAGITPPEDALNINIGRKYTVQFEGPGGVSAQSPMSVTTGPVRGRKIVIHGLPAAADDITGITICCASDGTDGPFSSIMSIAPGATTADDTHIESPAGADEEGECEVRDGHVEVFVKRHGADWFNVTIPVDKQRSEIVAAIDLGRVEENTIISADIRHVLELPPTLEKPGRPCDVRLVFE